MEESNPRLLAFDSRRARLREPADRAHRSRARRGEPSCSPRMPSAACASSASCSRRCATRTSTWKIRWSAAYTKEQIALRRAIIMAFNTPELVRVVYQGQAMPGDAADPARRRRATTTSSTCRRRSTRGRARRCSTSSATSTATATAGASCPDGKPLTLVMASPTSGTRPRVRRDVAAQHEGGRPAHRVPEAEVARPAQDGQGGASCRCGASAGSTRTPRATRSCSCCTARTSARPTTRAFATAEFDALYRKSRTLPDGPERNKLYRRMAEIVARLQPVGARRVLDRDDARAAVGARLHEARLLGARVGVPRHRREAARRAALTAADGRCAA